MSAPRCWIGVACREHVRRGVAGGFGQLCHGKRTPLARMRPGDWIAYYSPSTEMRGGERVQAFTAIGRVAGEVSEAGGMHRRRIDWVPAGEAAIQPLLGKLSFVTDPRRWGYPFRRGHFEVPAEDMRTIAAAMGIALEET